MHYLGRVDEVICISVLSDGGCFEECVLFEFGSFGICISGSNEYRSLLYREHILIKKNEHCSMSRLVSVSCKSGEEISGIAFGQNSGIKLRLVTFPVTKSCSVLIMHVSEEAVRSCRGIGDSNRDNTYFIEHIVQIVFSIRSNSDIRSIQTHMPIGIKGIIRLRENNSLIFPVTQIIDGSRPAYIITQTECLTS